MTATGDNSPRPEVLDCRELPDVMEALADKVRDLDALLASAERWLDAMPRGDSEGSARAVSTLTRLVARAASEARDLVDGAEAAAAYVLALVRPRHAGGERSNGTE